MNKSQDVRSSMDQHREEFKLDNRIIINMLSTADKVAGQGVGSAYEEQVQLVKEGASDLFDVRINAHCKADINHFHTINPNFFVKMKTSKAANVAYCHFLPDTLDGSIKIPKAFFGVFKKYVTSFYRSADYLIVVNPIFMKELERYHIDKNKMVYIPNYVSNEQFFEKNKEEQAALRRQYGIAEDAFVVLGVGQVQTRKGVLDFVEVAKQMPDITFLWAGGFSFGVITDGYRELTQVMENPPANVKFLDIIPRSQMNDIFNIADVLFMPSYNELFPMSILEAVNVGRPLVLRDLELYEDILFHHYVKGKDNAQFVRALRTLKADPQEYKKWQRESKKIAQFYSKEHVLQIWRDFYTKVYKEHQPKKK